MIGKLLELGKHALDRGVSLSLVVEPPGKGAPTVSVTAVVNQGVRNQELLRLDERMDGRGNPYYWIAFERRRFTPGAGTDLWAIENRRISVTPLRLDMTDEPTLTRYAQGFA